MSHPTITSRVAAETVSLRKNGGETLSSQTVAHAPEPTSQRIIALNSIWNLIGQIAPILVAMCVIPFLVHHLGVDRFGVLTLAWILVGYLSLLDLGIGRATTKLLAEKLALGNTQGARNLVWTAILSMVVLGTAFAGIIAALAPWLSRSVLRIPVPLRNETLLSLYWIGLAIPFVTLTSGLRGMLEARQQFGTINVLRATLGFLAYLGPLMVMPFSHSLVPVVATLVMARIISCALHFWLCKRSMSALFSHVRWHQPSFRELVGFGSWITVSNVIGPLMVYLDRFLLSSMISISAVAYYTTPSELVVKLWIIPMSVTAVLFPAFSETLATARHERANWLYECGIGSILLALFPAVLLLVVFASEGLRFWLGSDFATHSATVLQVLLIGVFVNSLANIPYSLLQASGRPDWTAKLHLLELPCYAGLLHWTIRTQGINGAAVAWTLRLSVEAVILFWLAAKIMKGPIPFRLVASSVATVGILVLARALGGTLQKISFIVVTVTLFASVFWLWILRDSQRLRLRRWIKNMSTPSSLRIRFLAGQ